MSAIEPILYPVRISDLRPTQMTVGFREVKIKRKTWREKSDKQADDFLGRHMIPALKGPAERFYVLDHHHLIRALQDEGVKEVVVNVLADLSRLSETTFWTVCEHRA